MMSNKNNNFMRLTLNHATNRKPIISIYTFKIRFLMLTRNKGGAKDEGPL